MPMGAIDKDRTDRVLPLTQVFDDLSRRVALTRDAHSTGGPARYWRVAPWGIRLGLISPLTANFCDGCNRVRLTTEGMLYLCLGQDESVDLKAALRGGGVTAPDAALDEEMTIKPRDHAFSIAAGATPAAACPNGREAGGERGRRNGESTG